jgi:hypothetical protein
MREIGGYLEFERFYGHEYHEALFQFDSVRSCLIFIIQQRKYKKIYIPFYLCGCIKELLNDYRIEYDLYNINSDFFPLFNKKLNKDECLLIVNYFGQFTNNEIIHFKKKFNNIFIDNTQSFFQLPVQNVDTAYSCRKYFGVPDGAYLYSKLPKKEYNKLEFNISHNKMLYTMGRYESTAGDFFSLFKENELIKRGQPVKKMPLLVQNILKGINYSKIKKSRTENFDYIKNNISLNNELKIKNRAGLFFYPLLIKNGENIKKRLIKKYIFVPTFWENVLKDVSKNTIEYYFTKNIVLLPIDQRYTTDDMKYMLNIIKKL